MVAARDLVAAVVLCCAADARRVTVTDFGADPSGAADASAAVRAAQAAAPGGEVVFPAGMYLLSVPLGLESRQTVVAEPGAVLLQRAAVGIEVPKGRGCYRAALRGVTLQYNRTAGDASATDTAILFRGCQHCEVSGVSILGYNVGAGQIGIRVAPEWWSTAKGEEANFIFNAVSDVEIDEARVGVQYEGQAFAADPTPVFLDHGSGYARDGVYTGVPVVAASGSVPADERADVHINNGSVTRFTWRSNGSSLHYAENVTSPATALGGLRSGGRGFIAAVFQRPAAVISNNVWRQVTMRRVLQHGVQALAWADTERWYDLYVMLAAPGADGVSLGDPRYFSKIDRFHFHSPCIVYAPGVDVVGLHGVVLNPGVFRIGIEDLHTDKQWPEGALVHDISGAGGSYTVQLMSTGDGVYAELSKGRPVGPARFTKGLATRQAAQAVVPRGASRVAVPLRLARPPRRGEVTVTPACDLGGAAWWLGELRGDSFDICVAPPLHADCPFDWHAELGEL